MTVKRRVLTKNQKARIVLDQEGRCACGCGGKLAVGKIDFDHIKERRMAVDADDAKAREDLSNFQALLPECHKKKTKKWTEIHTKAEHQGGGRGSQRATRATRKAKGTYRPIKSRGFPTNFKKKMDGSVVPRGQG